MKRPARGGSGGARVAAALAVGLSLQVAAPPVSAEPRRRILPRQSDQPPPGPEPPGVDVDSEFSAIEDDVWSRRPLAFELHTSLGGPFGVVGGAIDYSPSAGLSVNLGAGVGHASGAAQLASTTRLRLLLGHSFAVGAEGGLAIGDYDTSFMCPSGRCPPDWSWSPAVWGSAGLMLEARRDDGLVLRWSFGAGAIFNVVDGECRRCDATDEPNIWVTTVPYTSAVVGWAFAP